MKIHRIFYSRIIAELISNSDMGIDLISTNTNNTVGHIINFLVSYIFFVNPFSNFQHFDFHRKLEEKYFHFQLLQCILCIHQKNPYKKKNEAKIGIELSPRIYSVANLRCEVSII